jgi:hypothetical protein
LISKFKNIKLFFKGKVVEGKKVINCPAGAGIPAGQDEF